MCIPFASVPFCFALLLLNVYSIPHSLAQENPWYGESYALVVGIDRYPSSQWTNLGYAVKDARGVTDLLEGQGFQVTTLFNKEATREAILTELGRIARTVEKDDRVLFFFAGHGYTEELGGKDWGYIVPYDGKSNSESYLSLNTLQVQSERMGTAKAQLFIMDACFGGLLGVKGGEIPVDLPNYLAEVTRRRSRQILTAGGRDEQVVDGGFEGHSVFTGHLIQSVQDGLADLNGDGYITFAELTSYVVPAASNTYQTPAPGYLPGHSLGEFVFRSPRGRTNDLPEVTEPEKNATTRGQDEIANRSPTDRGLSFVKVPAGSFEMGGEGYGESPIHTVQISRDVHMTPHEVTVGQFRRFVEATGYQTDAEKQGSCRTWTGSQWEYTKGASWRNPGLQQTDAHPVVCVSWNDAVAFAEWAGGRLPTEAEWEYAARAGTTGDYAGDLDAMAWYSKNSDNSTHPVGQKAPNDWGLYDMHGNVWEWVQDWYDSDYYDGSPTKDPKGPASGSYRVIRGGGWYNGARGVRSALRGYGTPDDRSSRIGFRIVRMDP